MSEIHHSSFYIHHFPPLATSHSLMSIDAYSPCPGGTGKKIKFCCGDFLPELQKIDRMFDGEQYLACLQHVDRLLAQEPSRDRACLLAFRCELLRLTDQHEAAKAATAAFLAKHPDNQVALAETAITAAETEPRAALDWQQRAMRAANGNLAARTYHAMGLTAAVLVPAGFPVAARALLQMQANLGGMTSGRGGCSRACVRRAICRSCCATISRLPIARTTSPGSPASTRPCGRSAVATGERRPTGLPRWLRMCTIRRPSGEPGHVARLAGRQRRLH